jgi:lipopolysaccharide/colanic/teichoic acid biosynthesis glycosyltransferase
MKIFYIKSNTKRILDLVITVPLIILGIPIILFLLMCVFINDFNFPIYISKRVGINGKIFNLYKIRTMHIDAELSGIYTTKDGDERLISMGMFLRKFKLDELPQFFNVILNDISLVGPRPNVIFEVNRYNNWEYDLLKVKPGLTDLSSIVFFNLSSLIPNNINPN